MKSVERFFLLLLFAVAIFAVMSPRAGLPHPLDSLSFDVLLVGGRVVDGTGNPWYAADVGIRDGRIAAIGKLAGATAKRTIDVTGLVVAPGFIDMLGQSEITLLVDGRAESKIRQGITTEITGEGGSIAPQNDKTWADLVEGLALFHVKPDWHSLDDYFGRLEKQGTAINLGTFVGATQVRMCVMDSENRAPSGDELQRMEHLVAEAMEQGALGLSTSLVYSPAIYAKTDELVALAQVAARYGGTYASHIRNEGTQILPALDEAFTIGREAHIPVQVFHLKVAGKPMWGRMGEIIQHIERARAEGIEVTADLYPYLAGATALAASLPPWAQEGGTESTLTRLADSIQRRRMKREMLRPASTWQNFFYDSGGAENILISFVASEKLKPLQGKRLSEVAKLRGQDPLDAIFDICREDRLQTGAIYFLMSEADLDKAIPQPWVSFGLDASAVRPDGILGSFPSHPRAYGTFPRLLGLYTRQKHLASLEEMIRKMTSLAAQTVRIEDRGVLKLGLRADVTVFDFATIHDVATYDNPNRYSEGIRYVLVNGQLVLEDGKMTGNLSGQVIRGPGYIRKEGQP